MPRSSAFARDSPLHRQVVAGPRQVGKTKLVRQAIQNLKDGPSGHAMAEALVQMASAPNPGMAKPAMGDRKQVGQSSGRL